MILRSGFRSFLAVTSNFYLSYLKQSVKVMNQCFLQVFTWWSNCVIPMTYIYQTFIVNDLNQCYHEFPWCNHGRWWKGLLLVTYVSTTGAEAIFKVKWLSLILYSHCYSPMSSSGSVEEALAIIDKVQEPEITDLYTFFMGNNHIVCIQAAMNTILRTKSRHKRYLLSYPGWPSILF